MWLAPVALLIHGQVFADANRDQRPTAGERGVAGVVVAYDVLRFATTDAHGQFTLDVPDDEGDGIVWARVPDGYVPGPVWARVAKDRDLDLALEPLAEPVRGPLTFVVAADTHLYEEQTYFGAEDLATAARAATSIDPAFFTILGDVTQGNKEREFQLVDQGLDGLGVPYVPVPGNHDWYDGGDAWHGHYGPDNYSFDLAGVHFVVWNLMMAPADIKLYLGSELSRVDKRMPIVALTHAPPAPEVVDTLRELGVAYVLTGHAHSNRVVDHGGVIELNTEPFVMGALDFTPAGYRVVTIDAGKLTSFHRTTVDAPYLALTSAPCSKDLVAAAEIDAAALQVTARIDCGTPIALDYAGGWSYRAPLPPLDPGAHAVFLQATSASGRHAQTTAALEVCKPEVAPTTADWPQLGGGPAHAGATDTDVVPPLATRWATTVGGHVITAPPVVARGMVVVATTDLADGSTGAIVALDAATGAQKWRAPAAKPLRGAPAVIDGVVVAAQTDGVVRGLDLATGAEIWRLPLSDDVDPASGAIFASVAADGHDALVGSKRKLAAIDARSGVPVWSVDPVPDGTDTQSLAAVAIDRGLAVGVFHRALGGVIAWDAATGKRAWRFLDDLATAINATPVMANGAVYVSNGITDVFALDASTGELRWQTRLDPAGFDWGNATVGTPAYARDVLVVPTLYGDAVGLDARSGFELWRHHGGAGPLHTVHYRGRGYGGFAASPAITGDIAWLAGTDGAIVALDLHSGAELWRTSGPPVLAGIAVAGNALVVASYDGTVRALAPTAHSRFVRAPSCTAESHGGGCCDAGGSPSPMLVAGVAALLARRRRRARG